jgi:hypothetical protein
MATKEKIQNAYIEHLLTEGKQPASVFSFAKKNKIKEEEFYKYYGSFDTIEASIWTDFFTTTIAEIKGQEVWQGYSAREKALSFYFSFFEMLKSKRSFVNHSVSSFKKGLRTPVQLKEAKEVFEALAIEIIQEGLETGEISDRKFISDRYKDALWMQVAFLLNFWVKDFSAGFEKTDEAIEKGVNVTFDLFQRTPIDNLLDYGKFLAQNAGFKMPF